MFYEAHTLSNLTDWLKKATSVRYCTTNPHMTINSTMGISEIKTLNDSYVEISGTNGEKVTVHDGYDNMQILYYVALNMYKVIMGELELCFVQ